MRGADCSGPAITRGWQVTNSGTGHLERHSCTTPIAEKEAVGLQR